MAALCGQDKLMVFLPVGVSEYPRVLRFCDEAEAKDGFAGTMT